MNSKEFSDMFIDELQVHLRETFEGEVLSDVVIIEMNQVANSYLYKYLKENDVSDFISDDGVNLYAKNVLVGRHPKGGLTLDIEFSVKE